MKAALVISFLFSALFSNAQIVFSETFDEADNATTGADAIGPVTWTTTCPGSVALDDYFKVLSGKLEAKDTNSPAATWTTGDIDVSTCIGLQISVTIEELSNMEECADCGGTGAPCIDWVKLEYNLDGGGWTEIAGATCALAESPGEMIQIGDIPFGGPLAYNSPCIDFGTTLQVRISCKCWAAAEVWRFDDITVSCLDCVLPIEVVNYTASQTSEGMQVNWTTETERSNDHFLLERSYNGIDFKEINTTPGAGNSVQTINYAYIDQDAQLGKTIYYRLTQFDTDGNSEFTETITVQSAALATLFFSNDEIQYDLHKIGQKHLNIYNINGKLIQQEIIEGTGGIPWNKSGFFIIEVPELNLHEKLFIP